MTPEEKIKEIMDANSLLFPESYVATDESEMSMRIIVLYLRSIAATLKRIDIREGIRCMNEEK